jgi:ABC-type transporter Mla subunit MlaD
MTRAMRNLARALDEVDDFIRDNRGQLKKSVTELTSTTQTVVRQKDSVETMLEVTPLVLRNFLSAYNPKYNTLDGRGNLNELSLWGGVNWVDEPASPVARGHGGRAGGRDAAGEPAPAGEETSGPPLLLPTMEDRPVDRSGEESR